MSAYVAYSFFVISALLVPASMIVVSINKTLYQKRNNYIAATFVLWLMSATAVLCKVPLDEVIWPIV